MIALQKQGVNRGETTFLIWRNNEPTGIRIHVSEMLHDDRPGIKEYEIWSNDINDGITETAKNYTQATQTAKRMAQNFFDDHS